MKDIVFTMTGDTDKSTVASGRIATWLGKTLKLDVVKGREIAEHPAPRVMLLVNGPPLYAMGYLPEFYKAVVNAKLVVWINNDYTTPVPRSANITVDSLFWRAFAMRRYDETPIVTWSTCHDEVEAHPGSTYLNWNAMAYDDNVPAARDNDNSLFYYGAFRVGRVDYFDRYFFETNSNDYDVRISSGSDKFKVYEYSHARVTGGCVIIEEPMKRSEFFPRLAKAGLGLYIEDKKSHTHFHSPANRFYEMLSAHTPMVFQPECVANFKERTAYDEVEKFVATDAKEISKMMKNRAKLRRAQAVWRAYALDSKRDLANRARAAMRRAVKEV